MKTTIPTSLFRATILFLVASTVCGLVLAAIFFDLKSGGIANGSETSVTEFAQAALIGTISLLLFAVAARRPDLRGGLVLSAGFFLCMVIWENDGWLDAIRHGLWYPVALAAAAVCLVIAWRYRSSVQAGLEALCNPCTVAWEVVGLALLLVFSRIFGSKALWMSTDLYSRVVKTVAEESLELLADAFLFVWAILTLRALPPRPKA